MQCLPNNHPIINRFRSATKSRRGVDPAHVCDLAHCSFWNERPSTAYVCKRGLHVHFCSNAACTMATQSVDNCGTGFYTCPLSGIEMKSRDFVANMVTKIDGRGGARWLKAGTTMGTRGKSLKKVLRVHTNSISHALVRQVINSITSAQPPVTPAIERVARKINRRTSFATAIMMAASVSHVYTRTGDAPLSLQKAIARYCNHVINNVAPKPSVTVLIAVVFSLLAVGLESNGVQIFPVNAWVASAAPTLVNYAHVPHVQCRAMSTCTRALKRLLFQGGAISAASVFPTHELQSNVTKHGK